jgi:DNA-binding FrmR family transcriptional regulator
MSHVADDKKLRDRVQRLKGQVAALERTIEGGDCGKTLQLIAACRGAMGALMVEVLDSHIREHLLAGGRPRGQGRDEATEELIAILRSYLK